MWGGSWLPYSSADLLFQKPNPTSSYAVPSHFKVGHRPALPEKWGLDSFMDEMLTHWGIWPGWQEAGAGQGLDWVAAVKMSMGREEGL